LLFVSLIFLVAVVGVLGIDFGGWSAEDGFTVEVEDVLGIDFVGWSAEDGFTVEVEVILGSFVDIFSCGERAHRHPLGFGHSEQVLPVL